MQYAFHPPPTFLCALFLPPSPGLQLPPLQSENVQDIEDSSHLSLEQEKRRRAEEQRERGIDEKKLFIQRNLASMKTMFRTLQQRYGKHNGG